MNMKTIEEEKTHFKIQPNNKSKLIAQKKVLEKICSTYFYWKQKCLQKRKFYSLTTLKIQ